MFGIPWKGKSECFCEEARRTDSCLLCVEARGSAFDSPSSREQPEQDRVVFRSHLLCGKGADARRYVISHFQYAWSRGIVSASTSNRRACGDASTTRSTRHKTSTISRRPA